MRTGRLWLALLMSIAFATPGMACGDKLVQVGRGLRYQRANVIHPAAIVLFVSPAFDRASARHLRSELQMVGHSVRVVEDRETLASTIASTRSDIVLTDVEDVDVVSREISSSASKPTIIPVIQKSAHVAADIAARFPFLMMMSAREFDRIATINRAMK